MEITQFRAADLQPEVLTTIQMEWWMLSPLDAGGALQIHSPGSGLAFDLSVALQRWSFGNVPVKDATDFSQVEARKALLQISLWLSTFTSLSESQRDLGEPTSGGWRW
eukprot:symbB.v1.2.006690.t1/scaffold399.1/size211747/11